MPDPPAQRPAVRVSDPGRPRPAPDLLRSGREAPVLGRAGRRRLALALAAGAVLAAGGLVGQRVVEQRAAAAEAARTAGVVDLSVVTYGGSATQIGGDVGRLRFRLALRVVLRNDGPRPVTVAGAGLGPYVGPATPAVEPGESREVVLDRVVVCPLAPEIPPVEPAPTALDLEVVTAAGPREAGLALPDGLVAMLPEELRRACGVVTLAEALLVVPTGSQRRGTAVVVGLELGNLTSRPVRLTQLVVQQGLRSAVRAPESRQSLALPLDLPPRQPGDEPTTEPVELELTVASCRAIFQLTPAPPGQVALDTLLVTLEDPSGQRTGPLEAELDVPVLDELVSDVC